MRHLLAEHVPTRTQTMSTVAVLSLISTTAMLGLTNRADERFNPYTFGPQALADPLQVLTYPVKFSFETAQKLGNFRPLGRMVEHANYLVGEVLQITTGLPLHVVLGLVRLASAAVLAVLVVLLATRLVGPTPHEAAAPRTLVPFAVAGAFPGLLVAAGTSSSMVVFSGMYLQTTVAVVLALLLFTDPALYDPERRTSPPRLIAMVLVGMGVAVFNELAWVAIPAVGATVLALLVASPVPARSWWSLPALRVGVATAVGFLVLAVPIRLYLASACADGSCYAASDPTTAGLTASLYLKRVIAGLPLPAWGSGPFFDQMPLVLLLAAVAAAVVLLLLRFGGRTQERSEPASSDAGRRWWVPVVVGAVMVGSAAALSSLTPALQGEANPWQHWREAPVLFVGWALVLGGLAGAAADRARRPWGLAALVVVTALGVGSAVVGTTFQHARDAQDPRLLRTERIGVEIASFDRSEQGDERRCELIAEFIREDPDAESKVRRLRHGLDTVSRARYDQPFCSLDAPDG